MTEEKHMPITVNYNGQELITIQKDNEIYVAIRPIVEGIGMAWTTQFAKLRRNKEKFSCYHMVTTGKDGILYRMLTIPLKKLNGWLFSINPNKIKSDEIRDKVIQYQEECFIVLYNYWHKGAAINPTLNLHKQKFQNPSNTQTGQQITLIFNSDQEDTAMFMRVLDTFLAMKKLAKEGLEIKSKIKQIAEGIESTDCNSLDSLGKTRSMYKRDSYVSAFLKEKCVRGQDESVPCTDLFEAYKKWCYENFLQPLGKRIFYKQVLFLRPGTKKQKINFGISRRWGFAGISLVNCHVIPLHKKAGAKTTWKSNFEKP